VRAKSATFCDAVIVVKPISLPRQTWDKYRETLKEKAFCAGEEFWNGWADQPNPGAPQFLISA
jgi:hypothetical protein